MAVSSLPLSSTVAVRCQTGIAPSGGPLSRKKTFKGFRADASDQDVYDVIQALLSLMQDPKIDIILSKHFELIDEG